MLCIVLSIWGLIQPSQGDCCSCDIFKSQQWRALHLHQMLPPWIMNGLFPHSTHSGMSFSRFNSLMHGQHQAGWRFSVSGGVYADWRMADYGRCKLNYLSEQYCIAKLLTAVISFSDIQTANNQHNVWCGLWTY